jgi:hypothetical protein
MKQNNSIYSKIYEIISREIIITTHLFVNLPCTNGVNREQVKLYIFLNNYKGYFLQEMDNKIKAETSVSNWTFYDKQLEKFMSYRLCLNFY